MTVFHHKMSRSSSNFGRIFEPQSFVVAFRFKIMIQHHAIHQSRPPTSKVAFLNLKLHTIFDNNNDNLIRFRIFESKSYDTGDRFKNV